MPTIPAADLERLAADIFAARDVPRDDAEWIATLLVRANLRGHDWHGRIGVPQDGAALKSGHLNPPPKIQLAVDTPTIGVPGGDHGLGQVVARRGTALASERGRTHGLAAVAARRTGHVGRLADYAETLAAEGLVGMLWANAKSGLNVAPWGGSGKRLGTNPHAIAIPGPGGAIAMSHDFASSVWAEGKLRVKFNRGETVPSGIMLNARGEPSTDPREFYGDPPGSLLTAGAHKGYGLSLAIEILGGILSGTGGASAEKGKFAHGTLVVALDPTRFPPPAEFHAQVAALFGWVRGASPAAGASEILVPGEPGARPERARRAGGIPVAEGSGRQIPPSATA